MHMSEKGLFLLDNYTNISVNLKLLMYVFVYGVCECVCVFNQCPVMGTVCP